MHVDATSYLDLLVGGDDAALRQCDMNHLYSEDLKCSHSSSSSSSDAVVKVFDAKFWNSDELRCVFLNSRLLKQCVWGQIDDDN